jgi:hypothetical protein
MKKNSPDMRAHTGESLTMKTKYYFLAKKSLTCAESTIASLNV